MTLNTGIFDVSDPQNPDRVYSAALLCRMMAKQIRDGIVHEDGNEMAVTVTDPPAMTVLVGTGTAMVQGRFCENDAALTLAVPTAHATYPRIDRVVVRLNASPGRTIDIVVKPGTAAPEPAAPALTRTAETWELSLAQVRVEAGATLILSAKITDERGDASLCGVACPAYVPSSVLEIVEGLAMQGMPLVGLPAPATSTAAATKGYVDSTVSGAIGSFGISDIDIDEDKDWDGKSITNISTLQNQTGDIGAKSHFVDVPGDIVRKEISGSWAVPVGETVELVSMLIPSDYDPATPSALRIQATTAGNGYDAALRTITVKCNGVAVGSVGAAPWGGTCTINTSASFGPGDTLTVEATHGTGYPTTFTVSKVQVCSARSTVTPAKKIFAEKAW